jgi:hypothetical protein
VLAEWAVCICLKRKEITRGKKGKTSEEDVAFRRRERQRLKESGADVTYLSP